MCLLRSARKGPTFRRSGSNLGCSWPRDASQNATVDAAKARQRDNYVWDRELAGFGLKVTPAGRKVYLVQYRLGGRKGRTRRVTIGQHGELTPTAARAEAKRLLGEIAAGRDPAAERDSAKTGKSLASVLDQFMTRTRPRQAEASTLREYQRSARLYVTAFALRRRPIGELKRPDIARLHHESYWQALSSQRTYSHCSPSSSDGPRSMECDPMAPTPAGMSRSIAREGGSVS